MMFFKEGHHSRLLGRKNQQNSPGPNAMVKVAEQEEDGTKEMEKLKVLMAEVNKTLIFIKAVVSKGKTEVLPGTASVILETVMQIFAALRFPLLVQESNSLVSSQSKVCQNLAKFIAWTDDSLVGSCGDSSSTNNRISSGSSGSNNSSSNNNNDSCPRQQVTLDQEQAKAVIDALLEGLEELTKLGLEKMSQKRGSPLQTPAQSLPSPTLDTSKHASCIPDIPLTPREKEILAQTSLDAISHRSSSSALGGRSSNASSVFSFDSADAVDGAVIPPPKPPLPPGAVVLRNRPDGLDPPDPEDGLIPPPLPQKKRLPSGSTDLLDPIAVRNSKAAAGLNSSTSLDQGLGLAGQSTVTSHSTRAMSLGGTTLPAFNGTHSQSELLVPLSIASSSLASCSSSSSSSMVTTAASSSTTTSTQQQQQQFMKSTTTTQQTFSRLTSDSKLISGSSSSPRTSGAVKPVDQINQLTGQMKELATEMQDIPPPLPAKKNSMQRLNSQYDNIPESIESRLAALSATSSVSSQQRTTTTTVVMRKVERISSSSSSTTSSQSSHSSQSQLLSQQQQQAMHQHHAYLTQLDSGIASAQETYSSSETFSSNSHSSTESLPKPPPLPPKKRHVQDYMQTFGALTQPAAPVEDAISRHSITFYETLWQQHQRELNYPRSNTISVFSNLSNDSALSAGGMPGVGPGGPGMMMLMGGGGGGSVGSVGPGSLEGLTTLPALPVKVKRMSDASHGSQLSTGSSQSDLSLGDLLNLGRSGTASDRSESPQATVSSRVSQVSSLEDQRQQQGSHSPSPSPQPIINLLPPQPVTNTITPTGTTGDLNSGSLSTSQAPLAQPEIQKDSDSDFCELSLLDDVEIEDQLVFKKEGEEGPEVRGGAVDALIVHATQAGKIGSEGDETEQKEFMYQEAFLTTYRMFISSKVLIEKLLYRFHKFHHASDHRKKLAHNAFSLLIRVLDELGSNEMEAAIVERLMLLVHELICEGALNLARLLRRKLLEKCQKKQAGAEAATSAGTSGSAGASSGSSNTGVSVPASLGPAADSQDTLLSFKSLEIAEQMTLLDAQLFQKIEIPEVLLWPSEQSEELSPNLTVFTEHFNKMSYWCRTRILTQDDPRDREKYHIKFIKIMRHLKDLHNFNSYLAILSAVDSAPVRRLEWPEKNLEILHKLGQLIDSKSSFKTYRQALAETDPPCIPYLGLILQDLTFVNYGNPDKLADGNINFAKHWQQFNILDSMRRFRTSNYRMARSERIVNMFNDFEDYLQEEPLWQMSQRIKPRGSGGGAGSGAGGHKKQNSVS